MPKPIQFRLHAEHVLAEREIAREWVERTVLAPEWIPRLNAAFAPFRSAEGAFFASSAPKMML